jgi:SAM-dependent methyltransferase
VNLDCTTDAYAELYERWLEAPGRLLDLAGLQPGERVIDLCGGTGIVAKEALRRGARSAFVVDLNPGRAFNDTDDVRMLPPLWGRAEEVDRILQRHIDTLHDLPDLNTGAPIGCLNDVPGQIDARVCRCVRLTPDFDLVVCRQAIGYLDIYKTAYAVANVLRPGGRFVFNTFQKPKFSAKHYQYRGRRFFEASAYVGRTVFHVQALLKPVFGIDVTRFRWHREHDLDHALAPYFEITKSSTEKSLYYVCTRRERS